MNNLNDFYLEKKRLEMRNKATIEALPGFIFIFDDKFFLCDVLMPESMKLFHSMKELVGMDGRNIYTPDVCELFIENIHGCLADGQLREIEYPVYLKGLSFYYQARIVPYEDNKVLAFIQDIGDRVKRIEEMIEARKREEANLMKSAFLANMSHEIRTPLNAIVGFSEVLIEEKDTDNKKEFIKIIRTNSDLLLQLVNDILDISRIESGKIEIIVKKVNLNKLLREIADVYQIKMPSGVTLELILPTKEINTYTDPYRIKQILYNFLSNAVKHTTKGCITLKLHIEEDGSLLFSVSDTGAGIEEEKMPLVFNRFVKLNNYTQGTGLGLSISKSLVENLGGKINASSVIGQGSTFSFNLPHTKNQKEAKEISLNYFKKANHIKENKKKILLIEPSDTDYHTIKSILDHDYQLIRATTGEEACDLYLTQIPDLLLINISAPSFNAVDIIKKVRTFSSFIPIISLTTYGNYTDQEFAIKAGVNDVVLKPFSTSKLQDAIVAYI